MIQQQMQLHRPFRPAILGPVKKTGAKIDHRGVQAEKLVPEPELLLSRERLLTPIQKLIEHLLVKLPGTMLIGVSQSRPLRGLTNPEMPHLSEGAGQPPADLPKGVRLPQLAKQHGHKVIPNAEPLDPFRRFRVVNRFKELPLRKYL